MPRSKAPAFAEGSRELAGLLVAPAVFVIGAERTTLSVFGQALRRGLGICNPTWRDHQRDRWQGLPGSLHSRLGNVIRLASLIGVAHSRRALPSPSYRPTPPRPASALLCSSPPLALLVCFDLFRAGMGYNPAIDR